MDVITAASDNKPAVHVPLAGSTVTLYRTGLSEETVTDEGQEPRTFYRYTEYRFQPGEYDLVRQGMLPGGADTWTEDLRRIERSFLYDQADVLIAKADDYPSDPKYAAYSDIVREYKRRVRDTVNQVTFPESVDYPPMPRL